jgi:hypothetical protein
MYPGGSVFRHRIGSSRYVQLPATVGSDVVHSDSDEFATPRTRKSRKRPPSPSDSRNNAELNSRQRQRGSWTDKQ